MDIEHKRPIGLIRVGDMYWKVKRAVAWKRKRWPAVVSTSDQALQHALSWHSIDGVLPGWTNKFITGMGINRH